MQKRWILRDNPDSKIVEKLCKEINVSSPVATILSQRKIYDFESAKKFFRPKLEELHDPFLMKDMGLAIERLNFAIKNNEKILIYGDYDVDGTCSVALMYSFLNSFYHDIDFYIPDRYSEGYGISDKGIEFAKKENYKLVIALDCGIKAIEQVKKASKYGIDFIICDHHKPGRETPNAKAILNPKQEDCTYPYKELTGCAIGFKLVQGYVQVHKIKEEAALDLLDFTSVSIACDIVPITGENRILAKYGLEILNKIPRPGFKALKTIASLPDSMNITNLVFGIGPRINAAGRIKHAKNAVELLISTSEKEARDIARDIQINNETRKSYDEQITFEALSMIEEEKLQKKYTTVLYKEDWHKGVIGIVASRCIEKYHRPTIIITKSNDKATGSARSVKGFDIYEAITACSKHLDQFGGHKYAAGITLKVDNLSLFAEAFENIVKDSIQPEDLIPKIEIDAYIEISQISDKFFNILEQMAPFGPENRKPVFVSKVCCFPNSTRVLKEKHLKMKVCQQGKRHSMHAIAFNFAGFCNQIASNNTFYICYTIEKNEYRGKTNLQLMIKDIKIQLEVHELASLQNNLPI